MWTSCHLPYRDLAKCSSLRLGDAVGMTQFGINRFWLAPAELLVVGSRHDHDQSEYLDIDMKFTAGR